MSEISLQLIDETDELYQPRLDYDEAEIKALADDIKKCGQRNPIGVEPKGDKYRIIYGFQRVKALQLLGYETVKAIIYEGLTEEEAHYHSLSDNLQHGDLSDLEKAFRCKYLRDRGQSIEQLCEAFNVKKSVIYNYLKVTELDPPTNDCLHLGLISLNHAVELARLDVSKRLETLKLVVSGRWSIRDLKGWIHSNTGPIEWLCLEGCIPICPKHLQRAPYTKADPNDELYKNHKFKPPADPFSCDTCEQFVTRFNYPDKNAVERHTHICKYDSSHLPKGVLQLLRYANHYVSIEEEKARLDEAEQSVREKIEAAKREAQR